MNEVEKFEREANETKDLIHRFYSAYPRKSENLAALKSRWEAGDRNICKKELEDGSFTYNLMFTKDQKKALEDEYKKAHLRFNDISTPTYALENIEDNAEIFVNIIEGWADSIEFFEATTPENQKSRKRSMDSINVAMLKLDQALAELDSDALGFWYGNIYDALNQSKGETSDGSDLEPSMLSHYLRSVVEGGEQRQQLRKIITLMVDATTKAADNLPKFKHIENDPRLRTAKALERTIIENDILFNSSETGFSAISLRAIFDLAGLDIEKVSYWLKKVEDDPDSHTKWLERMRKK